MGNPGAKCRSSARPPKTLEKPVFSGFGFLCPETVEKMCTAK
jgi:hypothetical protein